MKFQTNEQIERELGRRLKQRRLELNLSQEEVARKGGLSRRTITAVEHGEGATLTTLISLFRVLDLLDALDHLLPEHPLPSPIAQLMLQEEPVKYASKSRKTRPATAWKWGDERP